MKLIDWQLFWKSWHFGIDKFEDDDSFCPYRFTMYYVFIGPLQMRWIDCPDSWWKNWRKNQ